MKRRERKRHGMKRRERQRDPFDTQTRARARDRFNREQDNLSHYRLEINETFTVR